MILRLLFGVVIGVLTFSQKGLAMELQEINVSDSFGQQTYHLKCKGEGNPVILLDGGIKHWSIHYLDVLEEVGQLTRTCVFDRPGYGKSSVGKYPRTTEQAAIDMAHAIEAARISTPFIIAGHSLGGLNALTFAALFRELVAAVVLIDSAHPEQFERLPAAITTLQFSEMNRFWRNAALQGESIPVDGSTDVDPLLNPESAREVRMALENGHVYFSMASELDSFQLAKSVLAKNLTTKLDVPLVVLSAQNSFRTIASITGEELYKKSQDTWMQLQSELLEYSSHSTQLFSSGDHLLQHSDPESIVNAFRIAIEKGR